MAGTSASTSLNVTFVGNGLQDGLKKWQKSLGLVRDETGKLFNAQKQWVDGLTKNQIELGLYRDGLDEIRNQQGQLVSGLRDWEIENGRYVDSMGNVYDAQNKLLRLGTKQLEQDRQLAASKQQIAAGVRSIGQPMISLATQMAVLGGVEQKQISNVTALTGTYFSMLGATSQVVGGLKTLRAATQGQTIAQTLLNAVTGNWVTLAAGVVAVGGVSYILSQTGDNAESASLKIDKMSESMKRLYEIARKSGRTEWTMADYGKAVQEQLNPTSAIDKERAALKERARLIKLENELEDLRIKEARARTAGTLFGGGGALSKTELNAVRERIKTLEKQLGGKSSRDVQINPEVTANHLRQQEEARQKKREEKKREDDKKREDAEKQQLETVRSATAYLNKSLPERQRRETELIEQIGKYKSAYASATGEQLNILNKAIDAANKELAENNTLGDLRKEAAERLRKENEERERFQTLYANRNESGMGGMWSEAQKKQLGMYEKYFSKAESAQEKFERMSAEIRQKGLESFKSQAEIDGAILNLHKETFPEMKKLAESTGGLSSASGSATYASAEAYKIIVGEKDRTAKAVEVAAAKQVEATNRSGTLVSEAVKKGFESLQSTA